MQPAVMDLLEYDDAGGAIVRTSPGAVTPPRIVQYLNVEDLYALYHQMEADEEYHNEQQALALHTLTLTQP